MYIDMHTVLQCFGGFFHDNIIRCWLTHVQYIPILLRFASPTLRKYRILFVLPWIPIFVTSEATRLWFSRVTKSRVKLVVESPPEWQKMEFTVIHTLYLISCTLFMPWSSTQTSYLKQSSMAQFDFVIFAKDGVFWLGIVRPPQFNLWRHANARYWHYDVTFVNCLFCTHRLTQRRSSHRFPVTRYSQISVQEIVLWSLRCYTWDTFSNVL